MTERTEAVLGVMPCGNEEGSDILDLRATKKEMRKRIRLLAVIAAMSVFSVTEFARGVFFAVLHESLPLDRFVLSIISLVGAYFGVMCARISSDLRYDAEAGNYLISLSDRYAKRTVDATAVVYFLFAVFLLSEWNFRYLGNSRVAASAKQFADTFPIIAVGLFFLTLDLLLLREVHARIVIPERRTITLHLLCVMLFAAVYWMSVAVVIGVLGEVERTFAIASIVFFLFVAAYDVTLRKRITHNAVWEKRRLAAVSALAVLVCSFSLMNRETWYTQPYINSVTSVPHAPSLIRYDDASGVYTLTSLGTEFKILHLTDIHLGGSLLSREKDILALRACYAEIAHTRPDLVIVTGDLTYPIGFTSFSFNNSAPVQQFAAFMRNVGIPWAFTYGNHDTESVASLAREELAQVYKSLSYKTSGTLLYPYVQPSVTGRNNQLIEVRNADGTLNTALFLLDSNAYSGEGFNKYDYIHDDQVAWYEREVRRLEAEAGGRISSLVFFHIPLREYRTAYDLYLDGSDEVTYYFGENNETMIDKICCSEHPSSLFDRMVALGSTTGVFCGHDHYNNMSLEYRGIRLTYGMSIDYLVMPGIAKQTAQRGAELITLRGDSSWDVRQIPLTSIE